jgi:glutaredoxin-like YruB-family protein
MNVTVYSTPTCGYCHQAKKFLSERGVNYTDIDVSRDREAAEQMVNLTGQMGVPVIVIDGEVIVGFNRPRIEQLIAKGDNGKHPSFGLSIADASTIAVKSGSTPVFGAFIGKVKPALHGDKAGLKPGDIITELNKQPVRNADDLEKALSSLTGGSRVAITFIRDDKKRQTEILV